MTSAGGPAVRVQGLHKTFRTRRGSVAALQGASFSIEPGEVLALLGPNGAGKTTTLDILAGFTAPDAGTAEVLGMDPLRGSRQLRERLGCVLQETATEPYLTVREALERNAGYYPRPLPAADVLRLVGLVDKADARVKTLSGGQQRRLDVALGIVGRPEVLFLDEPTTGFDPAARRTAWDLVGRLRDEGTTILLTTHYLDEAAHLADRVAVLRAGQVVASGTPGELAGRTGGAARIRFRLPPMVDPSVLPVPAAVVDDRVEIRTDDEVRALHALTGWSIDTGTPLTGLTVNPPTLEQAYLDLIGADER